MTKKWLIYVLILFNILILSTIFLSCNSDNNLDVKNECSHNFSEWVILKEACTSDGSKMRQCVLCKEKEILTIVKKGHSFTNYVYDGNATCLKTGTKTAVCDNGCGSKDTIVGAKNPNVHESDDLIYQVNLIDNQKHDVIYTCCNAIKETVSHKFTNYVSNNDASCNKDGTKTATCICGIKDTKEDKGSKLSHTGGIATCISKAICDLCGNPYSDYDKNNHEQAHSYTINLDDRDFHNINYACCGYIRKEEHSFLDYKHNTGATCDKNATESAKCSICNIAEDIREIPQTATGQHIYKETLKVDATCRESGFIRLKCDICYKEITEEIALKEHSYEQVTSQVGSCSQPKVEGKMCTACGDFVGIREALGHKMIYNGERFVCETCGYESINNGNNDNVIIELIEDELNYVIGYFNKVNTLHKKVDGRYELRAYYIDSETDRYTFTTLSINMVDDGVSKIIFKKKEVLDNLSKLNVTKYKLQFILHIENNSDLYIDLI